MQINNSTSDPRPAITSTPPHQHVGRHRHGRRTAAQAPANQAASTQKTDPAKLEPGNTTTGLMGDMNGDGKVDQNDVDAFVLAMSDREAYIAKYGEENYKHGDFGGTGTINFSDIDAFRKALSANGIQA